MRRGRRPWSVWLGLWGLESRITALASFWLSAGLAIASVALAIGVAIVGAWSAYWVSFLCVAVLLLLAALWYGLAIRWVDLHDRLAS
jgi:hypothetical protein